MRGSRSLWAASRCCSLLLLGCGRDVTTIAEWVPSAQSVTFEAEAGELSGFSVESDVTASNQAFIVAPDEPDADTEPGSARARYPFELAADAEITIWGRIRSADVATNRVWFRIDDGAWIKWRITVGDIWYWDDFHDDAAYGAPLRFQLAAGEHELWLANCVAGVALDRLYLTPDREEPAGNTTPCKPPHSIELQGVCHPSCGSQSGTQCGITACSGKTILESYDCDVCCRDAP